MVEVTQSMDDLQKYYPNYRPRGCNHKFKSNNWLKLHGQTMRRKPFKRELVVLDEFYKVY